MNWLENEKSECPICRFKLDSKEVKMKTRKQKFQKIQKNDAQKIHDIDDSDDTENSDETDDSGETTTPLFTPELTQQLLQRVIHVHTIIEFKKYNNKKR